MIRKCIILLLAISFLLLNCAKGLEVEVIDVKNKIMVGDTFLYRLRFWNNEDSTITVYLTLPTSPEYGVRWNYTTTTYAFAFSIPPRTEVYLPLEISTFSSYRYPNKVSFKIYISYDSKLYGAKVAAGEIWDVKILNLSFPTSIDPREVVSLKISIFSNLEEDTTEKKIEIYDSSGKIILEKHVTSPIAPAALYVLQELLKLNDTQAPGDYTLVFTISFLNSTASSSLNFSVLGYEKVVPIAKEEITSLFGREIYYAWKNEGTQSSTFRFEFTLSFLDNLFLTGITPNYVRKGDKIIYEITLQPGEEKEIRISISYLPLILIPVVIIVAGWVFLHFRRGIILEKNVVEKRHVDDKIEAKIVLRIRNTTSKRLSEVEIIDVIPKFVHEIGAFSAKAILNKEKRTVRWELPEISAGEEVIISYKVRSRLQLVGEISIPPFELKCKVDGKTYSSESNYAKIVLG
ncbi:MAG: hypothetical protein QW507_02935 [Candidatus Nanoarchaeia archaeon]|nr:hypothetical protein [Candidatus Haiyanarchaeum thermophilum]MCW1303070.1 hypothetical protein [Candidatus Haiyanarchaeum thermophilum]MCW1303735.1 hypothetical protein [Candidatus Haiyanarchaeum thermophilum]MCW1306820.1 hypothetical protein [Candidatus Haiyanarchaeum thermophilum]MCW1307062.1 hypothetical protein [Candidatus Haiyanarchaeum thermophilum]